jgi:putative iron-regulated protein
VGTGPERRGARRPPARRRAQYLEEATQLLVRHLDQVSVAWSPSPRSHRARFLALESDRALAVALRGAGTFLAAELAGERLTVPYETKDQEDETSCFSDNSHNDIILGLVGFDRLLRPELLQLVEMADPALATRLATESQTSLAAARAIPAPFDRAVQGADGGPARRAILRTIQAVRAQADTLARARDALAASRN